MMARGDGRQSQVVGALGPLFGRPQGSRGIRAAAKAVARAKGKTLDGRSQPKRRAVWTKADWAVVRAVVKQLREAQDAQRRVRSAA